MGAGLAGDVFVLVVGAGGAFAAGGFDVWGERDRPLPGGSLACGEVAVVDPVLDGLDGDAEFRGGLGDGELCVAGCRRVADFVVLAEVARGVGVEGASAGGAVACGVERGGEAGVVHGGPELPGQVHGGRAGAEVLVALDEQFLGGAGVPPQSDPQLAGVAGGQEGDVAEEGAQHPFAVLVAGGRGAP